MGRNNNNEDGDDESNDHYTTIKMSLRNSLQHYEGEFSPARNIDVQNVLAFKRELDEMVLDMTKCTKLASLDVHCCLNDAQQIRRFFVRRSDKHLMDAHSRGVQHLHDANYNNNRYELYEPLQDLAVEHGVAEPNVRGYHDIFHRCIHYTCFRNNIWMHAKQRMWKFCHLTFVWPLQQQQQQQQQARPTKPEVVRTLRYLFYNDDRSAAVQPSQTILDEFRNRLLIPNGLQVSRNRAEYHGYFWQMKEHVNWYYYVPIFLRLQLSHCLACCFSMNILKNRFGVSD